MIRSRVGGCGSPDLSMTTAASRCCGSNTRMAMLNCGPLPNCVCSARLIFQRSAAPCDATGAVRGQASGAAEAGSAGRPVDPPRRDRPRGAAIRLAAPRPRPAAPDGFGKGPIMEWKAQTCASALHAMSWSDVALARGRTIRRLSAARDRLGLLHWTQCHLPRWPHEGRDRQVQSRARAARSRDLAIHVACEPMKQSYEVRRVIGPDGSMVTIAAVFFARSAITWNSNSLAVSARGT